MRAIKILLLIVVCSSLPTLSQARNEDFGIFQVRKKFDDSQQILIEYVRRDRGELFQEKYLDLYRLSWGRTAGSWGYLLGGAYVDFETGSDERRLHQFFIRSFSGTDWIKGFVRLGLEERSFIADDSIYLRGRARLQAYFLPQLALNPVAYDEVFYVHNGQGRFKEGFNENRMGVGARYALPDLEFYLFHISGYTQTLKASDRFEWIQIQIIFSF
jgi:hypothetical protein